MRKIFFLFLICAFLLVSGCSDDRVSAPMDTPEATSVSLDEEAIARALVEQAGWPMEVSESDRGDLGEKKRPHSPCSILYFERTHVTGDIYHYTMHIPVGTGPHEVIGLHRVVKESQPYRPIRTQKTLFGLHGSPGNFSVMYLAGSVMPSAPDDQSIAAYLAENDVDVWGIDQAHTLLPQEVSEFSFMEDWGMQFGVDNLRRGMGVARLVRLLTGNGFGKMNLMGYSTGLMTGFAALNEETQLPPWRRHIGGFIPVDYFFKTDEIPEIEGECDNAAYNLELLEAGIYHHDSGFLFQTLGFLALSDPEGDSPIIPGTSNLVAALMAGTLTGAVFGFPDPDGHFLAGVFDEDGIPIDLQYTQLTHYLEWLMAFNFYGPNVFDYDISVIHCDQEDSPFDDYLHEINVPVFFLGANGGWGDMMEYTSQLLIGCDDISLLNVQLHSEKLLDIGHVDIYTAGVSQQEFWEPVRQWIDDHAY